MATRFTPEHHRALAPPSATKKATPGQPWSHQETIALIEAYEAKWYGLKRGQLKAQQWEEVSAAIAARCGLEDPPKTGTQCRHKVEKLRKRYRAERARPYPPSSWPYFDLMDRMDGGPLPVAIRLPPVAAARSDEDEDEEEDEEEEEERVGSNTRSINGILREGNWGFSKVQRNHRPQERIFEVEREEEEEEEDDEEEDLEEEDRRRGGAMSELAAVVRRFGEGMVRMEKRRMEIMREVERDWMEMEAKRAEMVIDSQRSLVETIAGAFASIKKAKRSHDDV